MDLISLHDLGSDKMLVIRSETHTKPPLGGELPPDLKAHRDRLIEGFGFSRWFILTYQPVIVGVVALAVLWKWGEGWRRARRRSKRRRAESCERDTQKDLVVTHATGHSGSSSSSSTRDGDATPPSSTAAEQLKTSGEWSRLLDAKDSQPSPQRQTWRICKSLSSWLMYQPAPLPLLNEIIPENTTTLFVLALAGLNIFYLAFNIHPSPSAVDIIADRAGMLFTANLPWLYLLSAKNCPLKPFTGHSYENLNLLHRRLGEWMCFLALVHLGGMIAGWYDFLRPIDFTLYMFLTLPYVLWGCGAWICFEVLYLTSLASFREWWYEVFLASHVLLQIGALVTLYMHHVRARPFVAAALVIFVLDRLVWRLRVKRWEVKADLEVMTDGETVRVSADWPVQLHESGFWRRLLGFDMQHGWLPSQHVFITVPGMGRAYSLQAHPMTIASAAPAAEQGQTHAWFNLIIRAKSGFSRDLLHYAKKHSSTTVKLDGPYGSMHALELLRESDLAIIVAGGSGIAVAYPMLWDLLHRQHDAAQQVCLIWIAQDASHVDWIGLERLEELKELGLDLVIPGPSKKSGRPDVKSMLRRKAEEVEGRIGVVVSGPDGLNRSVRNACAEMVGAGREIDVAVEKFGW